MTVTFRSLVPVRWMLTLIVLIIHAQSTASESDPLESNIPVVLTPTRLRQSLADVPASVTVITAEMLRRFGVTSVPDALRLVPGMAVSQVAGNDFRINYHGTNILVPRRMNVLIDGMSIYRPALARVDWKELPVVIDDIDRIEVTRGPNSASYGANSMVAIINIITKHPRETQGTTIAGSGGSLSTAEGMARYGGIAGDSTTYRVTANRQIDDGFDGYTAAGSTHDGMRLSKLNFRSVTDITNDESLDLQAAFVQGTRQTRYVDSFQRTYPDIALNEYYLNARWRKTLSPFHDVQVQAYTSNRNSDQPWTTCPPAAMLLPQMFSLWRSNPAYANALLSGRLPFGGTAQDSILGTSAIGAIRKLGTLSAQPICVDTNQNYVERRSDIEIQDTYIFSDALRVVSGIGARHDVGDSLTYLGGRMPNNSYRVFANAEYKPVKWLNINAGGFLEKDQFTGIEFSPRVAMNAHVTDNHTFRFVVSKGTRMPDIQEQRANWAYFANNFRTPLNGATQGYFFQSATALGNLGSERNLSREIGYLGNLPLYGILIDAKIFDDKLSSLISEKPQVSNFAPTNNNSAHLRGAELQINYEPNDRWMLYLAYSYLQNQASTLLERTQYSRHSGAFGITHAFNRAWRGSLAFYGADAGPLGQPFFGRTDLTLTKSAVLGKDVDLMMSFIVRHLSNTSNQYFQDSGKFVESFYKSDMQYLAVFNLAF